jgi:hypothetical protein
MRLLLSVIAFVGLCGASPASAQVVPDGTTRTSATTANTGRVTVNIAPANPSGISQPQHVLGILGAEARPWA